MTKHLVALSALIWLALVPVSAQAQNTNIVICFPGTTGITGNVTLEGFAGCIGALSASFEVTTPAPADTGGARASRPTFSAFQFTKPLDSASPAIFLNTVTGTRLPVVQVHYLQVGETVTEVAGTTLRDVLFVGVKQQASDTGQPTEQVSLSSNQVCVSSGGTDGCFDVAAGTVVAAQPVQ